MTDIILLLIVGAISSKVLCYELDKAFFSGNALEITDACTVQTKNHLSVLVVTQNLL